MAVLRYYFLLCSQGSLLEISELLEKHIGFSEDKISRSDYIVFYLG